MKMLARAALVLALLCPAPVLAQSATKTITIFGNGRLTDVTVPDDVAAWLVARKVAVTQSQADLDALSSAIAAIANGATPITFTPSLDHSDARNSQYL